MSKMIIESVIIAVLVMCVQVQQVNMLPVSKTKMLQLDLEETTNLIKTDIHSKQWYLSRTLMDPGADVSEKHILSRVKRRSIGSFKCSKGETLVTFEQYSNCVPCKE